jgi:predicted glycosyltransferase
VDHPERISGLVLIAPDLMLTPDPFADWAPWDPDYWLRDWPGFLAAFYAKVFTEPHSTKLIEDAIGWGLETDAATIVRGMNSGPWPNDRDTALELCARISCPTLVFQGTQDEVVGPERGAAVAGAIAGARLVTFEGSGHGPHLRDPVRANLILRDFACPPALSSVLPTSPVPASPVLASAVPASAVPSAGPTRWVRARSRPKRALFVSSPIGLGHTQRDVAIADELRKRHPGLEIDWLAQSPVTTVLAARGEHVHPASAFLASEAGHIESESAGHDLHAFQAIRKMDEILLANFMVFHDLTRDDDYDLWIGDEAWELDYYLHENPETKRAAYAWLTDFVGWLPMPDGGEREAFLTADYNAEMLEQIARFPRIRDRALFVGEPEDIVPDTFGPDLPAIRAWTQEHYEFPGYITGFDPGQLADRRSLGYHDDERVCLVTVGGSGVGGDLLRKVIAAYPEARERVPNLRMVVVTGPRIDPEILAAHDTLTTPGLEIRPYVPELYRHLAACDLAVVQGGLTTSMELTASRRPFLYFPLRHHFEQNRHVRHRLDRYRAGRCMDFGRTTPADIAAAIAAEIGRDVDYRPVATDGAARAAAFLAELL